MLCVLQCFRIVFFCSTPFSLQSFLRYPFRFQFHFIRIELCVAMYKTQFHLQTPSIIIIAAAAAATEEERKTHERKNREKTKEYLTWKLNNNWCKHQSLLYLYRPNPGVKQQFYMRDRAFSFTFAFLWTINRFHRNASNNSRKRWLCSSPPSLSIFRFLRFFAFLSPFQVFFFVYVQKIYWIRQIWFVFHFYMFYLSFLALLIKKKCVRSRQTSAIDLKE